MLPIYTAITEDEYGKGGGATAGTEKLDEWWCPQKLPMPGIVERSDFSIPNTIQPEVSGAWRNKS
jgi:hypothetical protein